MEDKKEEEFIPKAKNKTLKIVIAIILVALLAVGGYFLYKGKLNNPNETIINILENSRKEVNNSLDKKGNDIVKVNGIVSIDATVPKEYQEIANVFRNLNLQFSGDIDSKNNLANIVLNTKYKKEKLLDINLYYENSTMYLLLNGLYDKYLKAATETKNEIKIEKNDIKVLVNSIVNANKKGYEKLKFIRAEETITINGKEQAVYNNYVKLTGSELKNLVKDELTILSKDTEFTNVYKKLSGDEIKLDDIIANIDKQEMNGTYKISYYTTKTMLNPSLVSERLEVTENNITSTYALDKVSDDEVILTINSNGVVMSCDVKTNDSVFNVNATINAMGASIKFEIKTNFEKGKEIVKPNVSNSKNIEELTEQETISIYEKLQKNKGLLEFVQDISKLDIIK